MKTKKIKVFAESLQTDVFFRRKLGEDRQEKGLRRKLVFFRRKLDEDQKKGLRQRLKCVFF